MQSTFGNTCICIFEIQDKGVFLTSVLSAIHIELPELQMCIVEKLNIKDDNFSQNDQQLFLNIFMGSCQSQGLNRPLKVRAKKKGERG